MEIQLDEIQNADIVIAVDKKTDQERIIYGKSHLQLIAAGLEGDGIELKVLRIPADFASDDLEKICAMCLVAKGHYDE